MSIPVAAVVVFAADVARVSAFYRELGSMRTVVADDTHCVLEIGGFQITVHALRAKYPCGS